MSIFSVKYLIPLNKLHHATYYSNDKGGGTFSVINIYIDKRLPTCSHLITNRKKIFQILFCWTEELRKKKKKSDNS